MLSSRLINIAILLLISVCIKQSHGEEKDHVCPIQYELSYTKTKREPICYRLKGPETFADIYDDCIGNLYSSKLHQDLNITEPDVPFWTEYRSYYPGGPFIDWSRSKTFGFVLNSTEISINTALSLEEELCIVVDPVNSYKAVKCNEEHYRFCFVKPYSDKINSEGCNNGLKNLLRFRSPVSTCLTVLDGVGGGAVRATWSQAKKLCFDKGGSLLHKGWRYANSPFFPNSTLPLGIVMNKNFSMLRYDAAGDHSEIPQSKWNLAQVNNNSDFLLGAQSGNAWYLVNCSYIFYEVICEWPAPLRNVTMVLNEIFIQSESKILLSVSGPLDEDDILCYTDSINGNPTKISKHRVDTNKYFLSIKRNGYYWCIHRDLTNFLETESNKLLFLENKHAVRNIYAMKLRYNEGYSTYDMIMKDWRMKLREYLHYRILYESINGKIISDDPEQILKDFKLSNPLDERREKTLSVDMKVKRLYWDGHNALVHATLNPDPGLVSPGTWDGLEILSIKPVYYCPRIQSVPPTPLGKSIHMVGCITHTCVGDFNEGVQWVTTATLGCSTRFPVTVENVLHVGANNFPTSSGAIRNNRLINNGGKRYEGINRNVPPIFRYMSIPRTLTNNPTTTQVTSLVTFDATTTDSEELSTEIVTGSYTSTGNEYTSESNLQTTSSNESSEEITQMPVDNTTGVVITDAVITTNHTETTTFNIITANTYTNSEQPTTFTDDWPTEECTEDGTTFIYPTIKPPPPPPPTTVVPPITTQRPPDEHLQQVLDDLDRLVNNESQILVDDINGVFDEVNTLLEQHEDLAIPGQFLHLLDQLGSTVVLNETGVGSTIRPNIALLMADAQPNNPIRGIRLSAIDSDVFTDNAFQFISQEPNSTVLNTNESEVVVHLPQSVSRAQRRVSFVVFRNDRAFQSEGVYAVNSRVLSVNIENLTQFDNGEVIDIHLSPIVSQTERNETRSCAYWKFLEDGTGYWSQEGCTFIRSTQNDVLDTCRCDHLTHFAEVLVPKAVFSEKNEDILELITIIGCSLSIFGLFMIGVTALLFRSWRRKYSNKIWLQLCVAIFFLVLCFMVVIFVKFDHYSLFCMLIGIALHYSVLASFCWMLVAAVLAYRRLVMVFTRDASHKLLKASAFSWGLPCAIVGILLSVAPQSYAGRFEEMTPSGSFCYPSGLGLWLTVYAPIAAVLLANWILFALIVRSVFASRGIQRHGQTNEAFRCASVSCLLVFLFGLPWIFGLFAYNVIAAYLFTFTATFQGFILFLFFVIFNNKTRDLWLNKLKIRQTRKVPVTSSTYTNRSADWRAGNPTLSIEAKASKPKVLSSRDESRFS